MIKDIPGKAIYFLFFISYFTSGAQTVSTTGCGCDFVIQPGETYIDNAVLNAQAGDVVCIAASTKRFLGLKNFHGAPGNPIIFKNCGGQVIVGNNDWYYGIRMDNCTYFILTGTGDPAYDYGIKVTQTPAGTMGLLIDYLSTDFEVDHLDISGTGFAGIMAKSDPDCTDIPNRGNFIMKNVAIHDNYVHDTGGEGLYIGFPHYNGITRYCSGDSILKLPHEITGLKIYNNILESNAHEGIQVGCATSDVEIFNNTITNFGTQGQHFNNAGAHFCTGTVCRFYSNMISSGSGPGIWLNGIGDNYIFNNVISNVGEDGFMLHDSLVAEGKGYHIINNTVVNAPGYGIRLYTLNNTFITFSNNIFAGTAAFYDFPAGYIVYANNLHSTKVKPFYFQDASSGDYHLRAVSPAVDGGADMTYIGVIDDYEYKKRPQAKAYDVGAYESPFERVYEEFKVYPNPIHAEAYIEFIILEDANGSVKVYDELGRVVAIIAEGYFESGKKYTYKFDSRFLAHAMYFYSLETDKTERKLIKIIKVE